MSGSAQRKWITGLLVWVVVSTSLVLILNFQHRLTRAVIGMGCGLIVLWVFLCGGLMVRFQDRIRERVRHWRWDWRIKFVLMATFLACVEEAVTTSMTNLAPLRSEEHTSE